MFSNIKKIFISLRIENGEQEKIEKMMFNLKQKNGMSKLKIKN